MGAYRIAAGTPHNSQYNTPVDTPSGSQTSGSPFRPPAHLLHTTSAGRDSSGTDGHLQVCLSHNAKCVSVELLGKKISDGTIRQSMALSQSTRKDFATARVRMAFSGPLVHVFLISAQPSRKCLRDHLQEGLEVYAADCGSFTAVHGTSATKQQRHGPHSQLPCAC